jgi:hypothetical protein
MNSTASQEDIPAGLEKRGVIRLRRPSKYASLLVPRPLVTISLMRSIRRDSKMVRTHSSAPEIHTAIEQRVEPTPGSWS